MTGNAIVRMMADMQWTDQLVELNACPAAIEWAREFPNPQAAWDTCQRGDWMLWVWGRYAGEPWSDARRPLVLATCGCARLALGFVPDGERRPIEAIEVAERWANRQHDDRESVRNASCSAWAAIVASDASRIEAHQAIWAAWVAADVAEVSWIAGSAAPRGRSAECAEIVRKFKPMVPLEAE